MIRIYPTTTFSFRDIHDDGTFETLHYHVVTLAQYILDQDIDLYYIKEILISTQDGNTYQINPKLVSQMYLGYLSNSRELCLINRKDTSKQSWLFDITDVQLICRDDFPDWDGDNDV